MIVSHEDPSLLHTCVRRTTSPRKRFAPEISLRFLCDHTSSYDCMPFLFPQVSKEGIQCGKHFGLFFWKKNNREREHIFSGVRRARWSEGPALKPIAAQWWEHLPRNYAIKMRDEGYVPQNALRLWRLKGKTRLQKKRCRLSLTSWTTFWKNRYLCMCFFWDGKEGRRESGHGMRAYVRVGVIVSVLVCVCVRVRCTRHRHQQHV